jgi:glucokinase
MDPAFVVGIDFGGTKIDVALADAAGEVLERVRLGTEAQQGPEQALARTVATVQELARRSADHGGRVAGYAAVSPGVVREDRILLVPNLPGWERLALGRRLATALGVESVPVWNDVHAGALAELRHGNLRGADPGVYVSLGTGIAAAVTVGGTVIGGAHQAAGEIAYLVVGSEPVGAAASDAAPLEEIVGGKALGERASRVLGTPMDAAALFARTDPAAQHVLHHALGVLANAVANIAVLLDPARVVMGGGLMASADVLIPVLAAQLDRVVPFPPELVVARFTQDASLHGALALALDAVAAEQSSPGRPPCAAPTAGVPA